MIPAQGSELLSKYGQVELHGIKAESYKYFERKNERGDVDLFFEGAAATLKNMNATRIDCLKKRLSESNKHKQADIVIIIAANKLDKEKDSIIQAENWLEKHTNKRLFYYNRRTNKFMEVKK